MKVRTTIDSDHWLGIIIKSDCTCRAFYVLLGIAFFLPKLIVSTFGTDSLYMDLASVLLLLCINITPSPVTSLKYGYKLARSFQLLWQVHSIQQ